MTTLELEPIWRQRLVRALEHAYLYGYDDGVAKAGLQTRIRRVADDLATDYVAGRVHAGGQGGGLGSGLLPDIVVTRCGPAVSDVEVAAMKAAETVAESLATDYVAGDIRASSQGGGAGTELVPLGFHAVQDGVSTPAGDPTCCADHVYPNPNCGVVVTCLQCGVKKAAVLETDCPDCGPAS